MKIQETPIKGAFVLDLGPKMDDRGWFVEALTAEEARKLGLAPLSAMCNMSSSVQPGTVRGLHWQADPVAQTKAVYCVRGAVHDVIVDVRKGSPSFGKHFAVKLQPFKSALYVPVGVAHGWQALEDNAAIMYLVGGGRYSTEHERGLRPDDPALAIQWPLPVVNVAERDQKWPSFESLAAAPAKSAPAAATHQLRIRRVNMKLSCSVMADGTRLLKDFTAPVGLPEKDLIKRARLEARLADDAPVLLEHVVAPKRKKTR